MDDILKTISKAEGSPEIKAALTELVGAFPQLLDQVDHGDRWRLNFMVTQQLVTEALASEPEVLWWELILDFVQKQVEQHPVAGKATKKAVAQLIPLLQDRFQPYGDVTLKEITMDTVRGITMMSDTLTAPKKYFVAPNAISLAQAHFHDHAWFRAVYAGKAPVGFMMMVDDPHKPEYFLWRFMIAEPYHGRGYGRQAIERLVDYVRTRPNATELLVSCGEGEGTPEPFYLKAGFLHTGRKEWDEVVLTRPL